MVTITGAGFDVSVQDQYKCHVSSCLDEPANTTAVLMLTTTTLVCEIPSFRKSCCAQFAVLKEGTPVHGSSLFTYTDSSVSIYPSVGPADGGTSLQIIGPRFEPNHSYLCKFTDLIPPFYSFSDPAMFVSSSTIKCVSPPWNLDGKNSFCEIVITEDDGRLGAPTSFGLFHSVSFKFVKPSWNRFSPDHSYIDFRATGSFLEVIGTEFDFYPRNTKYYIDYVGLTHQKREGCERITHSVLICRTPPWPIRDDDATVVMWADTVRIPCVGECPKFRFLPVWYGITHGRLQLVHELGNQMVTVLGSGFSDEKRYDCCWSSSWSFKDPVCSISYVINYETMICSTTPLQPIVSEQIFLLDIQKHDAQQVRYKGDVSYRTLQISARWDKAWTSTLGNLNSYFVVTALGGTEITVGGIGFSIDSGIFYTCLFECTYESGLCSKDTSRESFPAQVLDPWTVTCLSPQWTENLGNGLKFKTELSIVRYLSPLFSSSQGLEGWTNGSIVKRYHQHVVVFTRPTFYSGDTLIISRSNLKSKSNIGVRYFVNGDGFLWNTSQFACRLYDIFDSRRMLSSMQCKSTKHLCIPGIESMCPYESCTGEISIQTKLSKVLNSTSILCVFPQWTFPLTEANLMLSFFLPNGDEIPVGSSGGVTKIIFCADIIKAFPSQILHPMETVVSLRIAKSAHAFFDEAADDYSCRFLISEKNDRTKLWRASPATPVSSYEVTCMVPKPDLYIPELLVEIVKSDSVIAKSHASMIQFVPSWFALNISTGTVEHTDYVPVQVLGWNLNPLSKYKVRFSEVHGDRYVESIGSLCFQLPKWPYDSAVCGIEVFVFDEVNSIWEKALPGNHASEYFRFLPSILSHSEKSGILPIKGCTDFNCLPFTITVYGHGFNSKHTLIPMDSELSPGVTQLAYYGDNFSTKLSSLCELKGLSDSLSIVSEEMLVISSSEMTCTFKFQQNIVPQVYQLNICYLGVFLQWEASNSSIIQYPAALRLVKCPRKSSQKSIDSFKCTLLAASRSEEIELFGDGFRHNAHYICRFKDMNGSDGLSTNSFATVLSSRAISCLMPNWPFKEAIVRISLQDTETGYIVPFAGLHGDRNEAGDQLQLVSSWWFQHLHIVPVTDSRQSTLESVPVHTRSESEYMSVTVIGRAFDAGANYFARFAGVGCDGSAISSPEFTLGNVSTVSKYDDSKTRSYFNSPLNPSIVVLRIPQFSGCECMAEIEVYKCSKQNCSMVERQRNPPSDESRGTDIQYFGHKILFIPLWNEISIFSQNNVQMPCRNLQEFFFLCSDIKHI